MGTQRVAVIGGGLGAVARHWINRAGLALLAPGFPWWTLAVNVSGSFLIGLLAGGFVFLGHTVVSRDGGLGRGGSNHDGPLFLAEGSGCGN